MVVTPVIRAFVGGVLLTSFVGLCYDVLTKDTTKKAVPVASTGRGPDQDIQLELPGHVEAADNALMSNWQKSYKQSIERCWRGTTYVIFFNDNDYRGNVGSVVILPDGKPLPC